MNDIDKKNIEKIEKLENESRLSNKYIYDLYNQYNKDLNTVKIELNKLQLYYYGVPCKIIKLSKFASEFIFDIKINNYIINNIFRLYNNIYTLSENELYSALLDNTLLTHIKLSTDQILKYHLQLKINNLLNIYIKIYNELDEDWLQQNFNYIFKSLFFVENRVSLEFWDRNFEKIISNYYDTYDFCIYQNLENWFIKKYINKFPISLLNVILQYQKENLSKQCINEIKILIKLNS